MCVGIGTGLFKDFGQAVEHWIRTEKLFEPDIGIHYEYVKHFARWRNVYAQFMQVVNQGLLTPMWRAPGT